MSHVTYILHELDDIAPDDGVGIDPKDLLGLFGQELVHDEADVVGGVGVDLHPLLALVLPLALVVGVGELLDVVLDGGLGQVDVLDLGKGGEGIVTDEVELHAVGGRSVRLDRADGGLDSGDGVEVRGVHDVDSVVAFLLLVAVEGVVHGAETATEGCDGGRGTAVIAMTQGGGRGQGDARRTEDGECSLATLVFVIAAAGGLRPRCNINVGKDVVVHYLLLLLLLLLLLELELTGAVVLVVGRGHDGTNFVLE